MGIYYSSNIGFGFIVDKEKLKAHWESLNNEDQDDYDPYEFIDDLVYQHSPLLSYSVAGGYDQENDFAIGVKRLRSESVGPFVGGFGIKTLPANPYITIQEEDALTELQIKIGKPGEFVFFAAFDQS